LPPELMQTYLCKADRILIVEEVIPFLEENVKIIAAELGSKIGSKFFFGKREGFIPATNEMNPDLVITALANIMQIPYEAVPVAYGRRSQELAVSGAPGRDMTFCAGCPHRASFWTLHNVLQMDGREGFACGDIGCYSLAVLPTGFSTLKTLHAMGSGVGLASGFGKLGQFGMDQPVLATVGDSTFFHAVLPALINAVHHQSDITVVVLDNSGTAMTGFQPHPGTSRDAAGNEVPPIDIAAVCEAMGATVRISDPFDIDNTRQTLLALFEIKGLKVLILQQPCALSPQKKGKKMFEVSVDENICLGQNCGCNQLCTRIFKCPGLKWNNEQNVSGIDEVICVGCGVCASVCPAGAILRKEVA
jgi:indolepyruvate ferredoxin oxidoreductase alpha subunit